MKQLLFSLTFIAFLFVNISAIAAHTVNDDTSCIYLNTEKTSHTEIMTEDNTAPYTLVFKNDTQEDVNYTVFLRYDRNTGPNNSTGETSKEPDPYDKLNLEPVYDRERPYPTILDTDTISQFLQYETNAVVGYAFGLNNSKELSIATKYTAGAKGFNISSISTWFIADYLSEGSIKYEIRAGGKSIENAVTLIKDAISYKIDKIEDNGKMYNIALNSEAVVYPYEDFYVIFTYPDHCNRPQGCVRNESVITSKGRYLAKIKGEWMDIQRLEGFSKCGWIMNVTEKEPKTIDWVQLKSDSCGVIASGGSSEIDLLFDSSKALPGTQTANVILMAFGSCSANITFPVSLKINDAPYFVNAPTFIGLRENEVRREEIEIIDDEENTLSVIPVAGVKFLTYSLINSTLILNIAPNSGDAGKYVAKFRVTDSKGASREMQIDIDVTSYNEHLEEIYNPDWFVFSISISE